MRAKWHKLSKRDKWNIRQIVIIVVVAAATVIPFIVANEYYFMDKLGWHSMAFPLLLVAAFWACGVILNVAGWLIRKLRTPKA